MKNLISWIEIPASDMSRAINFYTNILGVEITPFEIGDIQYGLFPTEDIKNTGALAKGEYYKPSAEGIVIYLDGGEDLQLILEKVSTNGGQVLMEKTYISPEAGYIGLFLDPEGNKIGLQSMN